MRRPVTPPERGPESPAGRAEGAAGLALCVGEPVRGTAASTVFRMVPLPRKTGSVPPFTHRRDSLMFTPFSRSTPLTLRADLSCF